MGDIYIFSDEEKEKIVYLRNLFIEIKKWNKKQFKISCSSKLLYLYTPNAYSDDTVNSYILNNEKEIYKKGYKASHPLISRIKIEKNQILFLGKIYTFKLDSELNDTYKIDDDNLIIYSNKNLNTKNNLLEFYHQQAYIIFSERVKYYSNKLNIKIGKITIGIYKSIWGSFGSINNHISLNEKLILAPLTAIDCIINHELAHYYHHNHSLSFYEKLEKIYPEYYKDYTWLSSFMPYRYPPKIENCKF